MTSRPRLLALVVALATMIAPVEVASAQSTTGGDVVVATTEPTTTSAEQVERWTEARAFVPAAREGWANPALAVTERLPGGSGPHFGLQLDGGIAALVGERAIAVPSGSVFAFFDFILDYDETFRLGLVGDVMGDRGCCDGSMGGGPGVAVRALFGADIGGSPASNIWIFRAGVEVGVAFIAGPAVGPIAVGRFELGIRLLDRRTLEIGIAVSGGLRPRVRHYYGDRSALAPGASVFVGWVFE